MRASGPYPTSSGTHEIRYREGTKHRSKTFRSERAAEAFKDEVNQTADSGKPIVRRKDVPTLEPFIEQWLAYKMDDLSKITLEKYAAALSTHVIPELGHLSLLDLRPKRLAQWQDDRIAAGAGRVALGKAQTLLGQILNWAVLPHEYLEVNPILALPKKKAQKKAHRWLTAFEVEQIRMKYLEWEDIGSATLVSVLAYVGIRPQDALALEWSDINGTQLMVTKKNADGEILPGSKTGDGYRRGVYLPPMVLTDLQTWAAEAHGEGLIFPRASDNKPWKGTDYANWRSRRQVTEATKKKREKEYRNARCFKFAADQVGLGWDLKPYDLRHTGATLFIAAGWNHIKVARQLGHKPSVSLDIYQHLYDQADHATEHRSVNDYIREARGLAPALIDAEVATYE